jgi:hypothetical protein
LSRCELLLLFRHFYNDPQSAKRGIKWTTSASLGRRVVPNLGYILFRLLRPSKAALEQIWGEARSSGVGRSLPAVDRQHETLVRRPHSAHVRLDYAQNRTFSGYLWARRTA